jgi:DNA-binding transcriptional ArsR family regulator
MVAKELNPIQNALIYALREGALGRRTLVQRTGITESIVRTHLEKLRAAGLVAMAKAGTTLTPPGLRTFNEKIQRISHVAPLPLSELALDRFNAAALVAQAGDALREGWRYRDLAVRAGASGALFLTRGSEHWHMSNEERPLHDHNPQDAETIEALYPAARPGDGLVIAFSAEKTLAGLGLWETLTALITISERSRSS